MGKIYPALDRILRIKEICMTNLTLKQAQKLESSGIITFLGFSGIVITAETASIAPQLCQVHASSGNVYDIEFNNGAFTLVENSIVYSL